ncbi:type I 3-dehydroquinate dehydratase [Frisingicoccus sp.]|uniref:type I 3-dehydroquinate dehydratase n=1 Tax=Frisingicoccus sp. TaxID=1918627 RepID=UPI002E9FEB54|nr:type I 3-dehydroquinate dehydratase [Frisingicoccus sp.]
MNTVYIKNLAIGEGKPKICIPICGKTKADILNEAENILKLPADIIEWRADWYEEIFDPAAVGDSLAALRAVIGEMPLLFTFRSVQEGGEKGISPQKYMELAQLVCESGMIDALDVELFMDSKINPMIVDMAHQHQIVIIASNHDFRKTPEKDELTRRMILMDEMGADILKVAVMPKSKTDVLELLSATEEMGRLYTEKPVITMSMGPMGLISRLAGEVFGSVLTFGAGEKASAPGQISARQLEMVLNTIHDNMGGEL